MLLNLSERSSERLKCLTHNLFSILRMIVGAYFLAKAVGLILVPGRATLMHTLFSEPTALTICATFFAVSGAFMLMGLAVRPIAVLQGFHVLSTTSVGLMSGMDSVAVELAQSGGLIVAIVLVAFGHPSKGSKIMELLRIRRAMRSKLPEMPELENMRQHSPDIDLDLTCKRPAIVSTEEVEEWGEDDAGNLFEELWERNPRKKVSRVA